LAAGIFYYDFYSKKHIILSTNTLYIGVKENKFAFSRGKQYKMDFKDKSKLKNHKFQLIFRQFETSNWNFELMKKIDYEIMKIHIDLQRIYN